VTRANTVAAVAGRSPEGDRLTVMALNKDSNDPIPLTLELLGFTPRTAEQVIVTGPTAGATNEPEDGAPAVSLTHHALTEVSSSMAITLPPHSANVFHR
jgi:alpha-L-arabinofuranosidase